MGRKNKNRWTLTALVVSGALVALINFSMADISQQWQMPSVLTSLLASALAIFLCAYAIGFTTIRISLVGIGIVALLLSVWIDNYPAKLRFRFAKSNFESVHAKLQDGDQVELPMWIGSFYVKKIKKMPSGEFRFWTAVHPYGNTGLVYHPLGQPELNQMFAWKMDENWHVVCVD